jgi:hypothetical protein
MLDLGVESPVTAGQAFNVCIRLPIVTPPPNPDRSEMLGASADIAASGFMKFYCRGRFGTGDAGWWHREFNMKIWVVIRATGNVPPTIENLSRAHDALGSVPTTVTCMRLIAILLFHAIQELHL